MQNTKEPDKTRSSLFTNKNNSHQHICNSTTKVEGTLGTFSFQIMIASQTKVIKTIKDKKTKSDMNFDMSFFSSKLNCTSKKKTKTKASTKSL